MQLAVRYLPAHACQAVKRHGWAAITPSNMSPLYSVFPPRRKSTKEMSSSMPIIYGLGVRFSWCSINSLLVSQWPVHAACYTHQRLPPARPCPSSLPRLPAEAQNTSGESLMGEQVLSPRDAFRVGKGANDMPHPLAMPRLDREEIYAGCARYQP